MAGLKPLAPDGRYFVARGRLWRLANPEFDPARRRHLCMAARRAVKDAKSAGEQKAEAERIGPSMLPEKPRRAGGGPQTSNTSYAAWYARDSRRAVVGGGRSQCGRPSENRERFALAAFNTLILTLRTAEHQGGSNGRAASKKVRLPQATRALRLCHASYKVAQRTSVQGAKCTPEKERFCRRETPCPPRQARANPTGLPGKRQNPE